MNELESLFASGRKETNMMLAKFTPAAVAWAEELTALVSANGRPLTGDEQEIARQVGVKDVEAVRILTAAALPPLTDFAESLVFERTVGFHFLHYSAVAIADAIVGTPEAISDKKNLAHQLRHVAQFKGHGGVAWFPSYMRTLFHHRNDSPLERQANQIAEENAQ